MLKINIQRLKNDMEELKKIGAHPDGSITRPSYTKEAYEAENYVAEKMRQIGMNVYCDPVGNLIGRWEAEGTDQENKSIIIGSHLDSVVSGGMFDGVLGVVAGLEVVRTLKESNIKPKHSIEVIAFAEEEANYYWGTFGSLAMLGYIKEDDLKISKSKEVPSIGEVLSSVGITFEDVKRAKRDPNEILAYLELHVEQGSYLDQLKIPVGIVEGIFGVWRFKGAVYGKTAHAGATPMEGRDDALVKASNLFFNIPKFAADIDKSMRATVGQVQVLPGNVNNIPNQVNFTLEMRSLEISSLEKLRGKIEEFLKGYGEIKPAIIKMPAKLDMEIQLMIEKASQLEQIKHTNLISATGHDAMVFGWNVPAAMIFLPSIEGKGHCAEENTNWDDVYHGTRVLMRTLLMLDEK